MENNILAAYEFYKKQSSADMVLLHVGDFYCVFSEDINAISKIGSSDVTYTEEYNCFWCYLDEDKLLEVLKRLVSKENLSFTIIEYRNSEGSFDAPKVKQIMQDIEDDY